MACAIVRAMTGSERICRFRFADQPPAILAVVSVIGSFPQLVFQASLA